MDKQYVSEAQILYVKRIFSTEQTRRDALKAYLVAVCRAKQAEVRDAAEK